MKSNLAWKEFRSKNDASYNGHKKSRTGNPVLPETICLGRSPEPVASQAAGRRRDRETAYAIAASRSLTDTTREQPGSDMVMP